MFLKRTILLIAFLLWAGWLFAQDFPFIGRVTKEGVNIRSGANVNFETLYQSTKNNKVIVKGKVYNWYKIMLPGDVKCFISAKYVKSVEPISGVVIADRVNIRVKPGEKYTIIGQAKQGTVLRILGEKDGWYAISPLENCYGWIHENFVKFLEPFNEEEAKVILKVGSLKENKESEPEVVIVEAPPPLIKQNEELLEVNGIIEPRGRIINRQGSHKLMVRGKAAYYLEGQPEVLDAFINLKVKVAGIKKELPASDLPVIFVKRIIASQ
jgi:uncharacterized protein YgiM (DUF1202 family)